MNAALPTTPASDAAPGDLLDQRFMEMALRLADSGWGRTYPNPMVGAVVVRDGEVIGRGWHAEYGGAHAEAVALGEAGERSRGATLYVTLEPCAHLGKQPPCVDAIIAAGVGRVVVASRDPDPIAAGGADRLRVAGIAVDVGVFERRAVARNFRFMQRFRTARRPFVAVKMAVSMDGKIADAGGNSRWLSSEAAREWVQWLRAGFGAVAVGGTTAIVDHARLTVRGQLQPRIAPVRLIFDRHGRLPPDHRLFADVTTAPVTVVVGSDVEQARRDALAAAGATLVVADALGAALEAVADQGVDSVLVEGGGRLAGALLREGLIDRVYQIQCALWLGDGKPAWEDLGAPALDAVARWRLTNLFIMAESGKSGDILIELEP